MSGVAFLRRIRTKIPAGFQFGRPLVLLQSDDWGRVGVRDAEGREELRSAGVKLGEQPYDLYSLETAEDVHELAEALTAVQDSAGGTACLEMNFALANVDFAACATAGFREIVLKPMSEGLPGRWVRPGLFDAYRSGIQAGVFSPALHGTTHFCQRPVAEALASGGERAELLRVFWRSETPYIHWRMPWVGYEYWAPERSAKERFLPRSEQKQWIDRGVRAYCDFFSENPVSACAPGYRADETTHAIWREQGVKVAQNGPSDVCIPPYFDQHGLLHTHRSIDFEPALHPDLNWEECVKNAGKWLDRGVPSVISIHSINFHSTLAPFRQKTLPMLRELLGGLKKKYPELLFVNSRQLVEIVETGSYQSPKGKVAVPVTRAHNGKGR